MDLIMVNPILVIVDERVDGSIYIEDDVLQREARYMSDILCI